MTRHPPMPLWPMLLLGGLAVCWPAAAATPPAAVAAKPAVAGMPAAGAPAASAPAASKPAAGVPAAGVSAAGAPALNCSGEMAAPSRLSLQLGKSTLVRLAETPAVRSVGNPAIVQTLLVAPQTLYIVGVDIGGTNMIIQGKSGACRVIDIDVGMDPAGLQAALASLMPEETALRVAAAADTLVLSGTVADAAAAARVMDLAAAYVRRAPQALPEARGEAGAAAASAAPSPGARLINLLSIRAPQQVMLEVKIAEVSKSLLDKLEVASALRYTGGNWAVTLLSNFLTGTAGAGVSVAHSNGSGINLQAQNQDGLIRILAEPTVMAISGQEGSFLAGGKIFIPVAQDNNKITLEEKEYGVGLRFTPTVLSGGRINLKVSPEVSDLSRDGIGISANGITGTALLPLITTRRASTTVQLFDGQSFAIGGLIKNNQTTTITGLPLLGELPVLGALFRSTDFQQDRTELLFVITPHLVKPLPPNAAAALASGDALPTGDMRAPARAGLFLGPGLETPAPTPRALPAAPAAEVLRGFELK
jgi:pilus assembly protein CpaC